MLILNILSSLILLSFKSKQNQWLNSSLDIMLK